MLLGGLFTLPAYGLPKCNHVAGVPMTSLLVFLLAIILALSGLTAFVYNRLITLAKRCDQAFADIDVQMRHRHDLVPNLVESVRGFASHERGIIETIMAARATAMRAGTQAEQLQAESQLTARLGHMIALVESNPQVQASSHFAELRRELADTEHKIAAARRFLNMTVAEYNAALERFPANAIGQTFGLYERRFFDLGLDRVFVEEAPSVKF